MSISHSDSHCFSPEVLTFLNSSFCLFKNYFLSWALVVYAYNPSYSGGRDQEDLGLKPAQGSSLRDPISKKTFIQKGWWNG
jgi:hypothetical protein